MAQATRPHRDSSYEIFLQGIDAFRADAPRRAPERLDRKGEDSDAALWLAGYDSEKWEVTAIKRWLGDMSR